MTYTAQRCAEYLEYVPDAGSCAQAAALALLSLDALLVAGGDGTGQWLSAAAVAAAMAVVYGVSLYRTMLTRARIRPDTSRSTG